MSREDAGWEAFEAIFHAFPMVAPPALTEFFRDPSPEVDWDPDCHLVKEALFGKGWWLLTNEDTNELAPAFFRLCPKSWVYYLPVSVITLVLDTPAAESLEWILVLGDISQVSRLRDEYVVLLTPEQKLAVRDALQFRYRHTLSGEGIEISSDLEMYDTLVSLWGCQGHFTADRWLELVDETSLFGS